MVLFENYTAENKLTGLWCTLAITSGGIMYAFFKVVCLLMEDPYKTAAASKKKREAKKQARLSAASGNAPQEPTKKDQ